MRISMLRLPLWPRLALLGGLLLPGLAAALPGPVVDAQWLSANREDVVVVETGRALDQFEALGHIPGAVLVTMDEFLAQRPGLHDSISYLVPSAEAFQATVRDLGVDDGDTVVIAPAGTAVYGDATVAARLYWQFRYHGHDDVAILDGGVAAWRAAGGDIEAVPASRPGFGDFAAGGPRESLLATSAEVERVVAGERAATLVDNRPLIQFAGITGRDYVRGLGHLPGARPLPFALFVEERGDVVYWRTGDAVNRLLSALVGVSELPMITYCNSGHVSALAWFALSEIADVGNVSLYDGSLHEWTLDGDRALVVGR